MAEQTTWTITITFEQMKSEPGQTPSSTAVTSRWWGLAGPATRR